MRSRSYAVLLFAALCGAYFLVFFQRLSLGVIMPELSHELGLAPSMTGWLGSAFLWIWLLYLLQSVIELQVDIRSLLQTLAFCALFVSIVYGALTAFAFLTLRRAGKGMVLLLYVLLPLQLIRELLIDLASEFGPYTFFCHGGVNSFLLFVYETPREADIAARNTIHTRKPTGDTSVGSGLLMLCI